MVQDVARKIIATNRKARHDYTIEETLEVGLQLLGTEVKSLRMGKANIREGFARIANNEVWLHNVHISPYDFGNRWNHEPTRPRKVLMHKKEIRRLIGKIQQQGFTLIPLSLYFNQHGLAKLELGLARGKKKWDKRESIAQRTAQREVERAGKARMFK
jgi:SsrA-binding protein